MYPEIDDLLSSSSKIGHSCIVFILQAVDKRQPIVPGPVNAAAAAAAKLITSSQAAAGKLGFHVGQSVSPVAAAASPAVQPSAAAATATAPGGILPAKKPSIPRGVPPPVPPNKPVVPPKKEAAAYLRRPELQSQSASLQQDAVKYSKQTASSHSTAANTATSGAASTMQTQQPLTANTGQTVVDEEVSNKTTTESR